MNKERIKYDNSAQGVKKELKALALAKPELEDIVTCFGPFLEAKAAFKEEFPLPQELLEELKEHPIQMNAERFAQGEPILADIGLFDFHENFKEAAARLLPPMMTAFPGIKNDLEKAMQGFSDETISAKKCVQAFIRGESKALDTIAEDVGIPPETFQFIMGQLVKPFMEMQVEILAPLVADKQWLRGYCPICGSYAAIAGLIGEGGKRWLQCATCGHEWRFDRHTCPKCNDSDHTKHDYFFDQDSKAKVSERVDICHACNSYLLTIDLRQRTAPVNMDIASMGMISLDMRAQEQGYTPLASTLWNTLK